MSMISRSLKIVLVFGLILFNITAFANESALNLGTVANYTVNSVEGVAGLITAICYIAGICLACIGMLKFKAHKDMPTQNPLSSALVLIFVGAALIWLPKTLEAIKGTLFDEAPEIGFVGPNGNANPWE